MASSERGFTLIELFIALVILGILMTLGLTNYVTSIKKSRDGKRKVDLEQIRSGLEMCYSDVGSYPSITFGNPLVCGGNTYLDPIPNDPLNSSPHVYTYLNFGGTSYSLCANQLEITGSSYCVTNP